MRRITVLAAVLLVGTLGVRIAGQQAQGGTGVLFVNSSGINESIPLGHAEGIPSGDTARGFQVLVAAGAGCQQLHVCVVGIDTSALTDTGAGTDNAPRFVSTCRTVDSSTTSQITLDLPKAQNSNQHMDGFFVYGSQAGSCFIRMAQGLLN
jgi:hypothetical protein